MSKNKLGITEGLIFSPSKQRGKPGHCIAAQVFNEDTGLIVCSMNATENEQEATNNAKVCADALEIANKNGLYPTQLLEQRDELIAIMRGLVSDVDNLLQEEDVEWHQAGYLETARELIQSIEKE